MLFRLRLLLLTLITLFLSPFLLALWLLLLLLNLVCRLRGFAPLRRPDDFAPRSGLASLVVLNWNGKELLAEGLPSILKAVQVTGRPHEVLVVDNGSTDGSIEYLREFYQGVRVLALPENLGFAEGNNAGVRAASNDVVILLNNDMIVDPDFLQPLLNGFGPGTFAVSSQIHLQDTSKRREETGKTAAVFRRGMIDYSHSSMEGQSFPRDYYPVLWAGGGSSAFHREKFLALGGFRDLYSPAYMEDTDLSYQAWSVGWEVLLAPDSVVYHKHRATSSRRFSPSEIQALITRNQFLFLWKNIHDWRLLLSHGVFLPWNCYRLSRDHGVVIWKSLFQAVVALPSVAVVRLKAPFRRVLNDRRIFELFSKPGLFFCRRRPAAKHPSRTAGAQPRILWLTAYLPHSGRHAGAGRMFELLKRLSPRYRITLATFLETDDERVFLPEVEALCEGVIAMRRSRPLHWQLFAYEPFDEFLTPEMQQAVDRCLEDLDFDLLQLEYTQMAAYADRAPGIPALLTKHEVDFAACARRAWQEASILKKVRWFYNYLQVLDREVRLTRKVDAVICMTDPDARKLKKYCASVPTHVINTGVDLDYFRPAQRPATASRLVFVGAFQHFPNVEAMVYFCRQILPLVRKDMPDTELLIVGSNPPPAIVDLSAIPRVRVTGFVPDLRPFMAESAVYVVPLRLGVGIRGKILEAWGMGMAVVSTSLGCAGLRYEHEKNLLVADTPKQFASQTVLMLKDPMLRQRLGEAGRKTAEQYYSWEQAARQLDELYQRHLASQVRPG